MAETALFQRVMGKLTWPDYMRLKRLSKESDQKIESIVNQAIVEYLDRQKQKQS